MYTLKIHWTRHEAATKEHPYALVDEATYFIPADRVTVHGIVEGVDLAKVMAAWDLESYSNSLGVVYYERDGDPQYANGRLIAVDRSGSTEWFLASRAWLLGPDGKTIERLT